MTTPMTMRLSAIRIERMKSRKGLVADQGGDVLVEFLLISGLLFGLFFAGIGLFLLVAWLQFGEMATKAGVRTAVVRDAAMAGLPTVIPPADGAIVGQSCSNASDPCLPLGGPYTCTGDGCTGAGFPHVLASMRQVFPFIEAGNIRITYEDLPGSRLGYAGGPPVWLVTVEIVDLPVPLIDALLDAALGLFGGGPGDAGTMRTIGASLTAEDLRTGGA